METRKLLKLILIFFLGWVSVTYIPNDLLKNWLFMLFVFAVFYFSALWVKTKARKDYFVNTAIIGLLVLSIVSVVFNRMGY